MTRWSRIRSLGWFFIAAIYFLLARGIASVAAGGLSSGIWFELVDRAILLFLLIVGFAAMGYVGQRQQHPVTAMGLDLRPTGRREFALGAAIGWTGMTACVLIIALFGGLVVFFYTGWRQFALIPLVLAILLVASLAEEVAFRGYAFQRFIEATNPFFAVLFLSLLFAVIHINNPGASPASFLVTMFAGWLLSIAYLRTRALWLGWGIHFAWNASMAILFGLPLSGLTHFSPVITSTALGPTWLSGYDYGPEGSAVAIVVILALIFLTLYATRGLTYQFARPVAVPAGSPADILAAAAPWQRPTATEPPPPPPTPVIPIEGAPPEPSPQSGSENQSSQSGSENQSSQSSSENQSPQLSGESEPAN
ncbi:MAG: type II CAAX endopeptidase family protein [Acidobacteriaceae bacterium]